MKNRKYFPRWVTVVIFLIGFLLIFSTLSLYKYFRIKRSYSSELVSQLWKTEQEKVVSFLEHTERELKIIRDLGQNGLLPTNKPVDLNKRFIPFLENQKIFSGLVLAHDKGWEYFLYKDKEGNFWISRLSRVTPRGTQMVFSKWKGPDTLLKTWQKVSSYDPRKRPWFKISSAEGIYWSPIYTFYETKAPGITASISWKTHQGNMVFGVDIPLAHIRKFLSPKEPDPPRLVFLFNFQKNYLILGETKFSSAEIDLKALTKEIVLKALEKDLSYGVVNLYGKKWNFFLKSPGPQGHPFYLGLVLPEEVLLKGLQKAILHPDPIDILAALLGGALLLVLMWRAGGLRRFEKGPDPFTKFLQCLEKGENSQIEFKSTVRLNLRTGKPGKEIELAWLKTIVAFLNSYGGTLLLGVNDEGKIIGLEQEGFQSLDKLQLHLKNLINQHIGAEFSRYINVIPLEVDGHTVIIIECKASKEPVFLKIGQKEEFYIRSGPSSVRLSPRQTVSYVLHGRKKGSKMARQFTK